MTNLFEILENAPKSLVLYCTLFGDSVVVTDVTADGKKVIKCWNKHDEDTDYVLLDEYGRLWSETITHKNGECLLFPTKYKRVWTHWQTNLIKPGMFVRHKDYDFTLLKQGGDTVDHCGTTYELNDDELSFASENQIKYFRDCATINGFEIRDGKLINIRETPEPQQEEKKEEEFEFEHFQKVLVRDNDDEVWHCSIFSHIDPNNKTYKFTTVAGVWKQCLPYNETTKQLIGTTLPYEVDVDIPSSEDTKYNIEIRDISKCQSKPQFIKIIKETYNNNILECKNLVNHVYETELPYILPFPKLGKNEAIVLVSQLKDIGVEAKII